MNANFFCTKFFDNPLAHGRLRRKSWTSVPKSAFSCGPGGGEKLFDAWASGVRVRNVRRQSGPKSLCLCCFFFPEVCLARSIAPQVCAPGGKASDKVGRVTRHPKPQSTRYQKRPDVHKIVLSIKLRFPPPPKKVSILRIFYSFVQFFLILGLFGGEVKPTFADKNFMDTQTLLKIGGF